MNNESISGWSQTSARTLGRSRSSSPRDIRKRCEACGSSHYEDEAYSCNVCLVRCFDAEPKGLRGRYGTYLEEDDIWMCGKCVAAQGYCDDDLSVSSWSNTDISIDPPPALPRQPSRERCDSPSSGYKTRFARRTRAGYKAASDMGLRQIFPFIELRYKDDKVLPSHDKVNQYTTPTLNNLSRIGTRDPFNREKATGRSKSGKSGTRKGLRSRSSINSNGIHKRTQEGTESSPVTYDELKRRLQEAYDRMSVLEMNVEESRRYIRETEPKMRDLRALKEILKRI